MADFELRVMLIDLIVTLSREAQRALTRGRGYRPVVQRMAVIERAAERTDGPAYREWRRRNP